MKLTESLKWQIDNMSYEDMLRLWRFAESGTPMLQDEAGDYFGKIMKEKEKTVDAVQASKNIGWS